MKKFLTENNVNKIEKFSLIGGSFLYLGTLALAGFWVAGTDIEALVVLCSLLVSPIFAIPTVLERFFLPNKKTFNEMSREELENFIVSTDANDDWKGTSPSDERHYFYKNDALLRLIQKPEYGQEFFSDWSDKIPSPNYTTKIELHYNNNLIEYYILVSVHKHIAALPIPDDITGEVEYVDYRIAEIFDVSNKLGEYMRIASIQPPKGIKISNKRLR